MIGDPNNLKPCPLCWNTPEITHNKLKDHPVTWISCEGNGHKVVVWGPGLAIAERRWNTRPIEESDE